MALAAFYCEGKITVLSDRFPNWSPDLTISHFSMRLFSTFQKLEAFKRLEMGNQPYKYWLFPLLQLPGSSFALEGLSNL